MSENVANNHKLLLTAIDYYFGRISFLLFSTNHENYVLHQR